MNGLVKFKQKFPHWMEQKLQFCGLFIAYEFSFHTFLLFS